VVACVLAAIIIRSSLEPVLGERNIFMFFVIASFVAAWHGGVWSGIAAALAGYLVANYCFVEPRWTFLPLFKAGRTDLIGYFSITGTAIVLLEALHRANRDAEKAMLLAESRGERLRSGMDEIEKANTEIRRLNAELEQRVRDRTAELEAVNRELEAFSYSVSHDLRAPVRSITAFSQAVLEDYQDKLDEEGVKYLRFAADAGKRMNVLIEDLLNLSRVTRVELIRGEVDLSALAQGVVANLRKQEPQCVVEVDIAPDLRVQADLGLLRIALENLFGNAWKFTSRTSKAKINLSSIDENGAVLFFIRDNGVGFDTAHAHRLFGVCQRLHSAQQFPGSGVGLATVKRIFNRHGGKIWAEAKVNERATFYFSLPKTSSDSCQAPAAQVRTAN